jgi:Lrp/AsnC family leucine-responsive transcriptional regulator
MNKVKLDEKDIKILNMLQKDCKTPIKEVSRSLGSPITTVYAKIKRLEELGVIKSYKAVLDPKRLQKSTTIYVLANVHYEHGEKGSKVEKIIAEKIAKFPNVQEVHIVSGEWDLLIKLKGDDIESIGNFVMEKLRNMDGITKTVTSVVFDTVKETTDLTLNNGPKN